MSNSLSSLSNQTYKLPVSVKGIIKYDGKYLLRKNERNEWELLGGKLEAKEEPIYCLAREIKEEAGIDVRIDYLIDAGIYCPIDKTDVLILAYSCFVERLELPLHSPEKAELAWFTKQEIETIKIPKGYKNSIEMYEKIINN